MEKSQDPPRFPIPSFRFIHFIGGTPSSTRVEALLRRLLEDIRRAGAAPTGARVASDLPGMREQLPSWLEGLSVAGGGLVVLDALNQLSDPVERELAWWPEKWPKNILLVTSVLPGDALRAMEQRGWVTESNTLTVQPLTPQQRRQVALEYLELFKKALEPRLLDRLLEAEQTRNPLFLRTVLEELRVRSSHEDLEARLTDMLQAATPAELFVRVLKNIERDFEQPDGSALVHRLFEIMGQARRGLSESELLQLLSLATRPVEEPVARGLLAPVFLALEDSLVSRDGQLSFFHDYLRQAVEREYLDEESEQVESHRILATPLVRWRDQAYGNSLAQYGHQHGIHHLLARKQGPLAPLLCPENLDQALSLTLDRNCREAGAEALASTGPFADSLALVRETLSRERPEALSTGVELTLLALGEPNRLKRHLLARLEESAQAGDWTTVARLVDAEPDSDGRLLAALRALRHAKLPPNPEWLAKMDRLAGETSSAAEWRQLLQIHKGFDES
jgi:hypothetical protein